MRQKSLLLLLFVLITIAANVFSNPKKYTEWVDPFIGTAGAGYTFPGPCVPFGMVQLSPDTRWNNCSGYNYNDKTIMGFSHTHLSGTGAPDYCDVLFMPTVGKIQLLPGDINKPETGYRSRFHHEKEEASPGYYSVWLDDDQIKAELTATNRVGFHRYTFPATDSANIIIDLKHRDPVRDSFIRIISDTEIEGFRRSFSWASDQYIYFVATFSRPFSASGIAVNEKIVQGDKNASGTNVKAFFRFNALKENKVLVKVGISATSIDGARKNLRTEIKDWDFAKIQNQAEKAWNKELSKIEVQGGTKAQRTIFYTALYHCFIHPNLFMDVDGQYRGVDYQIHKAKGYDHHTIFSLWDTFRALHPLFTIINQKRTNDFIRTFLSQYDDGGRLPMWELGGNYTDEMIGYHTLPVIADAYVKGIRDYDIDKAYKAMKHSAELDKLGLLYYKKFGYIPADREDQSCSKTLEYAYDDWCLSQVAKALGNQEDYQRYLLRGQFYKSLLDPSTQFMRGKNSDRTWVTPFDPLQYTSPYCETNAYKYRLFAPHDVNGMIDLFGGDQQFINMVDDIFEQNQYDHGNEPSHHVAYLYNYAGAAWKTQKRVRQILESQYSARPNGLCGNDDCGQMSAWYILSAMGFYALCPGQDMYVLGSPVFDKVTIHLENGKNFNIVTQNGSKSNEYVQSMTLNGKTWQKSYLKHKDIMNGSTLVFKMGTTPNENWGQSIEDRPFSDPGKTAVTVPFLTSKQVYFLYSNDTDMYFRESAQVALGCDTKGADIFYTLDGSEPTRESLCYVKPFTVDESTSIHLKAFKDGLLPSYTIKVNLVKAGYKEPKSWQNLEQGIVYDYYEDTFFNVNRFDSVKPLKSGVFSQFSIEPRESDEYFGLAFNGFIEIPRDGEYTFYIKSNDGSRLFFDGHELINNDGKHPIAEQSNSILLKAGFYPITVKYFQCGRDKFFKVSWKGPGFEKQEIPENVLFHTGR